MTVTFAGFRSISIHKKVARTERRTDRRKSLQNNRFSSNNAICHVRISHFQVGEGYSGFVAVLVCVSFCQSALLIVRLPTAFENSKEKHTAMI